MIRLRIRRCFGTCPWRRLGSFGAGRRRGWSLRLCRSLRWSFGRGLHRSLLHRYRVRRIRSRRVSAARFFGGLCLADSLYRRRGTNGGLPRGCDSAGGLGFVVRRKVGVRRIEYRSDHQQRKQNALHTPTFRQPSPIGKTTAGLTRSASMGGTGNRHRWVSLDVF